MLLISESKKEKLYSCIYLTQRAMGFPISVLSVLKVTASLQCSKELNFECKFRYPWLPPEVMKWKYTIKLFIQIGLNHLHSESESRMT